MSTNKERFTALAAQAMQGLLSNPEFLRNSMEQSFNDSNYILLENYVRSIAGASTMMARHIMSAIDQALEDNDEN